MSETDLVRAALSVLAIDPSVIAWRNHTGARGGIHYGLGVGSPDIICCVGPYGRLVGLEAKTLVGKQSQKQRIWQAAVEEHGGYYDLFTSVEEALGAVRASRARPQGWNPWAIK